MTNDAEVDMRAGGVLWLTFQRPKARNAMTFEMYDVLEQTARRANEDAAVTAREGAPAEIRDGERQGLIGQRLEVVDEQPALLEAGARGAERLQDLGEGVEGIRGVVSGHLVWRPAPHGGYTRRGAPASGPRRGAIARRRGFD